jgi:hypothetical protein
LAVVDSSVSKTAGSTMDLSNLITCHSMEGRADLLKNGRSKEKGKEKEKGMEKGKEMLKEKERVSWKEKKEMEKEKEKERVSWKEKKEMEKEKERVSWKEKKETVKETTKEKEKEKERERERENGIVKGERENGVESGIEVGRGINEQYIITGTTAMTSDKATSIEKNNEESEKVMEKEEETGMGKGAEGELITEQKINHKDLNKDVNKDKVENINMIKQDEHDKIENRPEKVITSEAVRSVIHGHGKKQNPSTSKNVELHRIDYSQREETKIEDGDISHESNEYYRRIMINGSELTVQNNIGNSEDLEDALHRNNLHVEAGDNNDNDNYKEENKDKCVKKEMKKQKEKEKEKEKSKEIEKEKEREKEREREVGWSTSRSMHTPLSVARMLPSLLKGSSGSRAKSSGAQVCSLV